MSEQVEGTKVGAASRDPDVVVVDVTIDDPADRSRWAWFGGRSARWALIVFVGYLVVSFFLILFHLDANHWFFGDDWLLLLNYQHLTPGAVLEPQHGHLSAVPILVFRALYGMFGVRTYVPYEALVIAVHLTVVGLLRAIMRRVGVGPWLATIAAATVVLFGAGAESISYAVQISEVGTLAIGLGQLLLTDHDGELDRRDAIAVALGVLAVFTSALVVVTTFVVGVAVLWRRGWRPALVQVLPPALVFIAWGLVYANNPTGASSGHGIVDYVRVNWIIGRNAFVSLGHFAVVGVLLAVLLVGGLVLAWRSADRADRARRLAMPLALLLGVVTYQTVTASVHLQDVVEPVGPELIFGASRFLYFSAVLALPALAVAAQAVVSRWNVAAPVVVLLLLVGVPWNASSFGNPVREAVMTQQLHNIPTSSQSAYLRQVPGDTSAELNPSFLVFDSNGLTAAWLLDAAASGKLPAPGPLTADLDARMRVRLGFRQLQEPQPPGLQCRTTTAPLRLAPNRGDRFGFTTDLVISPVTEGKVGPPVAFSTVLGSTIVTQLDGLELVVRGTAPGPFTWCSP